MYIILYHSIASYYFIFFSPKLLLYDPLTFTEPSNPMQKRPLQQRNFAQPGPDEGPAHF